MFNKCLLDEEKQPSLLPVLLLGLCQGYSRYHFMSQRPVEKTEATLDMSSKGDLIQGNSYSNDGRLKYSKWILR